MTDFNDALQTAQEDTRPREITRNTYRKHWRAFAEWCEKNGHECYPPDYRTVGRYMRFVAKKGNKAGTLKVAFAAIAWQIKCFTKVPDECRPESLKDFTLKKSPIAEALEVRDSVISEMKQTEPRRAREITTQDLSLIFRNDSKQRQYGTRTESREQARTRSKTDRALFLVMFNGLLRGSEAANTCWEDIEIYPDGSGDLHVTKNKISGKRRTRIRYLTVECVEALNAIRPGECNSEDHVFTERTKDGNIKKMCVKTIGNRLKQAARHSGIRGWEEYSSHSFRVGGAMHLYNNGATLAQIMDAGDWTTTETVMGYIRAGNREESVVKRLMSGRIAA